MKLRLDGATASELLASFVESAPSMGFELDLPDGIDVDVTNELIQQHTDRGGASWHVAPKRIAIRWHYKADKS